MKADQIGTRLLGTINGTWATPSLAAIAVAVMTCILLFNGLGVNSLPSFDDAYHAQTAKEMLHSLNPIGISYGGSWSFQSSPLPNWLTALSFAIFGVTEHAARLPYAILGLICVLAVYRYARSRWGEIEGVSAAFILILTSLFLRYARHVMAETILTCFIALALIALLEWDTKRSSMRRFGIYTGLAILTKSALGLLPVIIAGAWFLSTGRWKELFSKRFIISGLIAVFIASVWYVPAILIYGQTFVDSHIGAYLAQHTVDGHHADLGLYGLVFYFIWIPLQYLPWTLLLIPAMYSGFRNWMKDKSFALLILAFFVPMILLSLITSKYTRYLIPIFPAAALLIAGTVIHGFSDRWKRLAERSMAVVAFVVALVILALPFDTGIDRNADIKTLAPTILNKVPQGTQIFNFKLSHFKYQNPLLFYTDFTFTEEIGDPIGLWNGITFGDTRYCLGTAENFAQVQAMQVDGINIEPVESAGELMLFSVSMPSREALMDEFTRLQSALDVWGNPKVIGSYRLPDSELRRFSRRTIKTQLLDTEYKPRRLYRALERADTSLFIAWHKAVRDFEVLPEDLPKADIIMSTENLVLLAIRR